MENLSNLIIYHDGHFDEAEVLRDYHFYEKYDHSKKYSTEVFKYDYGFGRNIYEYKSLKVFNGEEELEYVIADIVLERSEWKKMAKYCQCGKCQSSWYDITSFLLCRTCIGCLKGTNPKKNKIIMTKRYIVNKNIFLK
jgi:hypothetical protein